MLVLHLAALFHGLTLFLTAVPKTDLEGEFIMLCLHEFLFDSNFETNNIFC